jgi:hypothetical protein
MKHIVHSFSLVAETFLYAFLGITAAVSIESKMDLKWHAGFIFSAIVSLASLFEHSLNFVT